MTKCPSCRAEAAEGAKECAACGLIFEKLLKRLELPPAPKVVRSPWLGRSIAFTLTVAWMIGLGLYYRSAVRKMVVKKPLKPAAAKPRPAGPYRDPVTGEMRD